MKLRFDTRDTKPKLTALLILTAVTAVIFAVLALTLGNRKALPLCILITVYAAGVMIVLIWAFREQIKYNPYSYNTIYYFGFSLLMLFIIITDVMLAVNMARFPEYYKGYEIVHVLLMSPGYYMLFTSPFLLVFSAALVVSNIALLRHEGKSFVNVLGIVLAFLVVGGLVFIYALDYSASGSQREVMIHDLVTNTLGAIYLYFECMILGTVVADAIAARYEPEKDKDFLIILGCGLKKDGTPTPLLRGRIERAAEFYEKQKRETGKELTFITSGGQGPDEAVSESAAMKRCLMELGIPGERIIEEDRSTDTFENMKNSRDIIWAIDPGAKVAFSTTNYHVFRSGLFARRVKMRAVGMGAKTKWYFWPNAAVREFAGLLTKHKLKQALILTGMIVFYLVLTIINYSN